MKERQTWRLVRRDFLIETPIFRVRRDRKQRVELSSSVDYFVLEVVDWVNVIPLTPDNEVVLIELHRHGVDEPSLEIPGGMIDPGDPSPLAAAQRELLEETGYESDPLVPLGVVHPNPAIQNNRCYTFLAPNARPTADPSRDEGEFITVVRYPIPAVPELLKEGRITHSLVVAAFLWYFLEGAPLQLPVV